LKASFFKTKNNYNQNMKQKIKKVIN